MINSVNGYNNTSFNGTVTFHNKMDTAMNFLNNCLCFCDRIENIEKVKILSAGNESSKNYFFVKCADTFNNKLFELAEKFAEKNSYTLDKLV